MVVRACFDQIGTGSNISACPPVSSTLLYQASVQAKEDSICGTTPVCWAECNGEDSFCVSLRVGGAEEFAELVVVRIV